MEQKSLHVKQNIRSENRKTVFLYIGIRVYRSDLLHTAYIKYLSEKYTVVVFLFELHGDSEKDKRHYYANDNITYIQLPSPQGKFWTLFDGLLRNEFIHIFDENPSVIWRNKRAKGDRRRMFLRRLSVFLPTKFFTPAFFTFFEKYFVPGYSEFKNYVKKYKPVAVLVPAPGFWPFNSCPILWAKRAHIPTVAINFSWDNLTSYPRHIRKTDYLICWNDIVKREAMEIHGYKEKQLFVAGIPRFDHYFIKSDKELSREEFLRNKGLDPKLKTIFFAAQTQGDFYKDFIQSFVMWQEKGILEPLNLFVRVHHLDPFAAYEEFIGIPNVHIERGGTLKQPDSSKGPKTEMNEKDILNMKYTLKYCDICVNVVSTVSIEACIFNKPVINIGFVPEFSDILHFIHFQPLIDNHAVVVAKDMEDVRNHIDIYLKQPDKDHSGRMWAVEHLAKPTDGLSYKRSVDFIDEIFKREHGGD